MHSGGGESTPPLLSIVVPIFNEEETIPELHRRMKSALADFPHSWELILVNDGSTDRSMSQLRDVAKQDSRVRVIAFSRNFGHQQALYAGICHARGQAVVLIDGDLQDPPEVIPDMVKRWQEGYEVVFAVRRKRKEGILKRTLYALYYRLMQRVSYVRMPLDSGDFSLLDREMVDILRAMPERNKFLRGLRAWAGFRQSAFEYERDARFAGEPKYTVRKLMRLALDGMISYSFVPLRIAYGFGALVSLLAFVLAGVYFAQRLFSDRAIPQGFTTIAILVLLMGGIQLLTIGVMGEYIGRIYDEVKHRPEFVIQETIGFDR